MKSTERYVLVLSAASFLMSACSNEPKFQVSGTVNGAADKMLYLEANALEGIQELDSVKLDETGAFHLSAIKTNNSPEFYSLRIDQQRIHFSIDSTESLTFTAQLPDFSGSYEVNGSESAQDIHDISMMQRQLQQQIRTLEQGEGFVGEYHDSIQSLVSAYKQLMKENYIYKNPQRASAYFAVCQSVSLRQSVYQLFDPFSERSDVKCYATIATAWDAKWPDSERTIQLCNMASKGMVNTAPLQTRQIELDPDKISEAGIIEVELPDINEQLHRLSDLKGKVVMLDFTVYAAKESASRTRVMRELYNKYCSRGLEIYQVSLDDDLHFWKFSCEKLPWICVHETDGRTTSSYAVTSLPTFFLINRDNEIVVRSEKVKNLEEELLKLL